MEMPQKEFSETSVTVSFTVLLWTSPEPGQGYFIRKQLTVISMKLKCKTMSRFFFAIVTFSYLFLSCRKHAPQHFLGLAQFCLSSRWCRGCRGWKNWPDGHLWSGSGSRGPVGHIDELTWNQVANASATDYKPEAGPPKLPAKSILFMFLLPTKCQESFQVRAITVKENRT